MARLQVLCGLISLVSMTTSAPAPSKWIDLTYDLYNNMLAWPGHTPYNHTLTLRIQTQHFYAEKWAIRTSEHMGTHMDAPRHTGKGKLTVDKVPLDSVIGDAVVINMTAKADKDRDAFLMPSDLEDWERTNGRIPDNSIVLLYTGWGKYWGDEEKYMGTDTKNTSLLHWPGIHPNATQWLVDNRKMKMYGVDCMSTDRGQSKYFGTHVILSRNNIPGMENVANLDKLPARGATVFAFPIKIRLGSGAPSRVVATIRQPYTGGGTIGSRGVLAYVIASVMTTMLLSVF